MLRVTHRVLEVEGFRTQDYPGGISPEGFFGFTARENYNDITVAERTLSLSHFILVPLENKGTSSTDIITA